MTKWSPSKAYSNIAEANRTFFSENAALYDVTETFLTSAPHQAMLDVCVDRILGVLKKQPAEIRALDACGGSGNISLKLLQRGIQPICADISPDLLEIFRAKCEAHGFTARTSCGEIGTYLADEANGPFDLIVFSSALHHLQDIKSILNLVFDRLTPGGVLFTIFDPTSRSQLSSLTKLAGRVEYFTFKVFHQSSDLPKAVGRRLQRMLKGASSGDKSNVALNSSTVGMLAEYHIEQGIDDLALVKSLQDIGFEVVEHDRYVDTRYSLTAQVVRWSGDATAFKLILRKPAGPA